MSTLSLFASTYSLIKPIFCGLVPSVIFVAKISFGLFFELDPVSSEFAFPFVFEQPAMIIKHISPITNNLRFNFLVVIFINLPLLIALHEDHQFTFVIYKSQ